MLATFSALNRNARAKETEKRAMFDKFTGLTKESSTRGRKREERCHFKPIPREAVVMMVTEWMSISLLLRTYKKIADLTYTPSPTFTVCVVMNHFWKTK